MARVKHKHKSRRSLIQVVAIVSAILYSSWPLGYVLNKAVSRDSLASGLEAVGQPYNWLFIAGDVASSLLALWLCWLLWQEFANSRTRRWLRLVLGNVSLFAAGTIIDALLPERCVPVLQQCPSFRQDHLLLFHGIFSIVASFCLFISFVIIWWQARKGVVLNIFLVAYVLFGAVSLIEALIPGRDGNWSQHYYISLCSLWIAVLPYSIAKSLANISAIKADKR